MGVLAINKKPTPLRDSVPTEKKESELLLTRGKLNKR